MLFYAVSVFSVAAFGLSATGESTLPVTTCKRDSADYSACLKHALEEAWPRFVKGLPEYNFPSLDPLLYEDAKLILNSGELHGELIASNITSTGMAKNRFFGVKAHLLDDFFHLEIDVLVPKLFVKGAARMNGAVSVFRVAGQGKNNKERLERLWNDDMDSIKKKILLRLYRKRLALEKEERKRRLD